MKKMKNIVNTLILIVLPCLLAGCVKDKGNYDYTSENNFAVEIGFQPPSLFGWEYVVGEEIKIPATVVVHDETLKPEMMEYTWYFEGEVVSKEKELILTDIPIGIYTGMLTITDTRNGVIYVGSRQASDMGNHYFNLRVTSEYTHGFAVLNNEAGAAKLGYIRMLNGEWEDYIPDIYPFSNNNEELGGEPVNLVYHSYNDDGAFFALQVNQNGGIGPVDIGTSSMERIGLVEREFIGGYPAGVRVKDMIYKGRNVLLLSESGDVYIRPEIKDGFNVLPHGGRFPNIPMYVEGGMRISRWVNTKCIQAIMSEPVLVIAFDDLNKRLVTINSENSRVTVMNQFAEGADEVIKVGDPGTDGTTPNSLVFPSPGDLAGYEMMLLGSYDTDLADNSGNVNKVVSVLKGDDDKYYCMMFDWFFTSYSGYMDIDLKKFFEFPVQGIDENMKYGVYLAGNPFMFFTANGNRDLWFMNLRTNAVHKVYSHTSAITAVQAAETDNSLAQTYISIGMPEYAEYSAYHNLLAIGGDDGKVVIFDADPDKVNTGQLNILKEYDTGSPVVDIDYLSTDWSQTSSAR